MDREGSGEKGQGEKGGGEKVDHRRGPAGKGHKSARPLWGFRRGWKNGAPARMEEEDVGMGRTQVGGGSSSGGDGGRGVARPREEESGAGGGATRRR